MIQAVIFDFDGVLIDSQSAINRLFAALIEEQFGIKPSALEILDMQGARFEERLNNFSKKRKIFLDRQQVDEAIGKVRDNFRGTYFSEIKLFPKALELVISLKKKGLKIAIGTNGGMKSVAKTLEAFNIKELFDAVVTFDDVHREKPDPEIFLEASRRLKIKPGDIVVIEDSLQGIEAAKKAGMKVIAVAASLGKEDLEGADAVVGEIGEIDFEMI